mmetsp:Transcript_19941/g.41475  ORF Transcript_19941/g.41475 Transcript_19941/m.41475 type:complete len:237 (+) Transcript_19941:4850-5560(+)
MWPLHLLVRRQGRGYDVQHMAIELHVGHASGPVPLRAAQDPLHERVPPRFDQQEAEEHQRPERCRELPVLGLYARERGHLRRHEAPRARLEQPSALEGQACQGAGRARLRHEAPGSHEPQVHEGGRDEELEDEHRPSRHQGQGSEDLHGQGLEQVRPLLLRRLRSAARVRPNEYLGRSHPDRHRQFRVRELPALQIEGMVPLHPQHRDHVHHNRSHCIREEQEAQTPAEEGPQGTH